jgi:hypothetical protein
MRLSDAGLHQRQTKALYLNHQPSPWLTEDATRDRSNGLLCVCASQGDMAQYGIAANLSPANTGSLELRCLDGASISRSFIEGARY